MVESLGICLRRLGEARQRLAFGLGHQAQLEVGELFELADVGKHRTVVRTRVVDEGNGGGWFPRLGHGAHSLQLDVVNVYPRSPYAQIDTTGSSLFCHLGIETRKIQPLWAEYSSGKHTARHLTSTGLAASRQSEPVPK